MIQLNVTIMGQAYKLVCKEGEEAVLKDAVAYRDEKMSASRDGGYVYHVLNRAVGRATVFETVADYLAFEKVLREANDQIGGRLLALCLLPNHWHLVLWPRKDGELSEYMRWLTNTHTRRWHLAHGTVGTGPLYQGRFKSFPVEQDEHFYSVCRYAEAELIIPCMC